MKNQIIIILVFLLSSLFTIKSQEISKVEALQVAKNFIYEKTTIQQQKLSVSEINNIEELGENLYFIINFSNPDMFVFVSALQNAPKPVLAYSLENSFNTSLQNNNSKAIVTLYKHNLKLIKEKGNNTDKLNYVWKHYLSVGDTFKPSKKRGPVVEPLLGKINWNQDEGWNQACPADQAGSGGHVYCGCVATAGGQIMKYYNHPRQGIGSNTNDHPVYGQLTVDFSEQTYDFAKMAFDEPTEESAKLLYHIGVAANANFGPDDGTSIYTQDLKNALVENFGYSKEIKYLQRDYEQSPVQWIDVLKNELNTGRPLLYSGFNEESGHAFVCDGYDDADFFHFNMGWSGVHNGYYSIDNIDPEDKDYNLEHSIIYNIFPDVTTIPHVNFNTDKINNYCVGAEIQYYSVVSDAPESVTWDFYGGTPVHSTEKNPLVTYNVKGDYAVTLSAFNSLGTSYKTVDNFISIYKNPIQPVCTPQTINLEDNYGLGISKVILHTINKESLSAYKDGGYMDYTCSEIAYLKKGKEYTLTIGRGYSGTFTAEEFVEVYIDYNNDGDFDLSSELVFEGAKIAGESSTVVIPPASAKTDTLVRMRVISDNEEITGPCYQPKYGQVEDYGLLFFDTYKPSNISLQTTSVVENSVNGSIVALIDIEDKDQVGDHIIEFVNSDTNLGKDNSKFSIQGYELRVNHQFDFEEQDTCFISLQVIDEDENKLTKSFLITVSNVNDIAPEIEDVEFEVDENAPFGKIIGDFLPIDPDSLTTEFTYTIKSGNKDTLFYIDNESNQLKVDKYNDIDYEKSEKHTLLIEVSDGKLSTEFTANITVNNLNDLPPELSTSIMIPIVMENVGNGRQLQQVIASDPDGLTDEFTYFIKDMYLQNYFGVDTDGNVFVVDSSYVDFEKVKTIELEVDVYDGLLNSTITLLMPIINLNDNPPVTLPASFPPLPENSPTDVRIGIIEAYDPDTLESISFSISSEAGNAFKIDSETGLLKVNDGTLIDYEKDSILEAVVVARDGMLSDTSVFEIKIQNKNDNAPILADTIKFKLVENTDNGSLVGNIGAIDPDNDKLFYSMPVNADSVFYVNENTGAVTVKDNVYLDYEEIKDFIFPVEVFDGVYTTFSEISIQLLNENDNKPFLNGKTLQTTLSKKPGDIIGKIIATDFDKDTLVYKIESGNVNYTFYMEPDSGILKMNNPAGIDDTTDYYMLDISVSDGLNSDSRDYKVLVTRFDLMGSKIYLDENPEYGTDIFKILADDNTQIPEELEIIEGNDENAFAIDPENRTIIVNDSTVFDYEKYKHLSLTVQGMYEGMYDTALVRIYLNNVNDNIPHFNDTAFYFNKAQTLGSSIIQVIASDEDKDDIIYSIESGNENDVFNIDPTTGILRIINYDKFFSDSLYYYPLKVTVTDGKHSYTGDIDINYYFPDDVLVIDPVETIKLPENPLKGDTIATLHMNSAPDDSVTYSITNQPEKDIFGISNTGVITILNVDSIDYEVNKKYTLKIEGSNGIYLNKAEVNIEISNENDNPPMFYDQVLEVPQISQPGFYIGTVAGSDADEDKLKFQIVAGNEEGLFQIDSLSGDVIFAESSVFNLDSLENQKLAVTIFDGVHTDSSMVTIKNPYNKYASVQSIGKNDILIYPNPSVGNFYISNTSANIKEVALFDLQGRCVHLQEIENMSSTIEVNTSGLRGIHFVKCVFDGWVMYKKIVVVK